MDAESSADRRLAQSGLTSRFTLQFIAEGAVVPAFEALFGALSLSGFDQVLQTTRRVQSGFATLRASFIALHAQLVLALP